MIAFQTAGEADAGKISEMERELILTYEDLSLIDTERVFASAFSWPGHWHAGDPVLYCTSRHKRYCIVLICLYPEYPRNPVLSKGGIPIFKARFPNPRNSAAASIFQTLKKDPAREIRAGSSCFTWAEPAACQRQG